MASAIIDRGMVARMLHQQAASVSGITIVHRRQDEPNNLDAFIRPLPLKLTRHARTRGGADEPEFANFEAGFQVFVGPSRQSSWALEAAAQKLILALHEQTLSDETTTHQIDVETVDESGEPYLDTERGLEAVQVLFRGTVRRDSGTSAVDYLSAS